MKLGKVGVMDTFIDGYQSVEVGCLYPSGRVVEIGDSVPVEWFGFPSTCSFFDLNAKDKYVHIADNIFVGVKKKVMYPAFESKTGRMVYDEDGDEVELVKDFFGVFDTIDQSVGPVDIEQAILEHNLVEETGVIVVQEGADKHIQAFVKLLPGNENLDQAKVVGELRDLVEKHLEEKYIPDKFVFLPYKTESGQVITQIPKTSAGKVKRRDLKTLQI